jgi:Ca2+-binding RTX toxin-like protein
MPAPTLFGSVVRANLVSGFDPTGPQALPSVAALPNGRILIGWSSASAYQFGIFRASGIDSGIEVVSTFSFNNGVAGLYASRVDVTALSDGRMVAAWNAVVGADTGEIQWVYLSDTEGQGSVNTIVLGGVQDQVAIAGGVNGRFTIVGRTDTNGGDAARTGAVNGLGLLYYDIGELSSGGTVTGAQGQPDIARLGDGRYITIWTDANDNTIRGTFLDANGGRLTPFVIANSAPNVGIALDGGSAVSGLANGGFIVSWVATSGTISYRLFDSAGAPTTAILTTSNFGANYSQAALGLSDGRIMLATATGSGDILGQMLNADGSLDGTPFTISATAGTEFYPDLAELPDGRVAVAFMSEGLAGGNSRDIAYQIVDPRNGPVVVIGLPTNDEFYGSAFGDSLIGAAGDDFLDGRGGDDGLYGGVGNDSLYGLDGADYLSDGAGNDYVSGGDGNDIFVSGLGLDTLLGGLGDDSFYVQTGDLVSEAAGQGSADRIYADSSFTLAAGAEIEFLTTSDNGGSNSINLNGNEIGQFIFGNAGNNTIDGGLGNDIIYPLAGADTIYFSHAPGASNMDTIVGYNSADDVMFLRGSIFTGIPAGYLLSEAFLSAPGATTATAGVRIIHNSLTGDLYWDADGTGPGAAVLFANVGPATPLSNTDFYIF